MTLRTHPDEAPDESFQPTAPQRRRYQRPRILYREAIEAVASDCAIPGGKSDASCVFGYS